MVVTWGLMQAIWTSAGGLLMKETDFVAGMILPHYAKWSLPTHTATPASKETREKDRGTERGNEGWEMRKQSRTF